MKHYTNSHEWIEINDGTGTVGVSNYAQNELGDIVYVELPELGKEVKAGEEIAVLESTKAAADVYSPVTGEVVAVNEKLTNASELINSDAEGEGWVFKIQLSDQKELDQLLDEKAYEKQIKGS